MGKIIVHIGLPKTATTTLQTDLFPNISSDYLYYPGVIQPRDSTQHNFFLQFCNAVNSVNSISEFRMELEQILSNSKTILISEEMFTVSSSSATWRNKLENLSAILAGFDYKIIFTVREPVSAMFSYYCELYSVFIKDKYLYLNLTENEYFMECALHRDEMKIFHYKELTTQLFLNFERERVYAFKFEDIINKNIVPLLNIISPEISNVSSFYLSNHNKKYVQSNAIVTKFSITPGGILRRAVARAGLKKFKIVTFSAKIFYPVIEFLDNIKLKDIKVNKLNEEEMFALQSKISIETESLEYYFGIKYVVNKH
jgi:hypothetical protein